MTESPGPGQMAPTSYQAFAGAEPGESIGQQMQRPVDQTMAGSGNQQTSPGMNRVQQRLWQQREHNKVFIEGTHYLETKTITTLTVPEPDVTLELPSRKTETAGNDWFTFVFLGSLVLLAIVRTSFGNYLLNLFQSLVNYSTASRMFRERNAALTRGSLILNTFSYMIIGLFFFQVAQTFFAQPPLAKFWLFLIIQGSVIVTVFSKKLIYLATGFVIENVSDTSEFLYHFDIHLKISGILLLPVVALAAWSPTGSPHNYMVAGLTIISILYIFLLWRGTIIFLKKQFSIFYLFLYLCTLEILPMLILLKIISA
ncbi:MAG TPA: hypothetical protein DCY35_09220 [Prolixibacteraceae bacterium]|nr:hypothetical protein [Prolixibacteraceae bacterium]